MKRRGFLRNGMAVAASALPLTQTVSKTKTAYGSLAENAFKLNYAPHDGMFSNHAGKNFVDQIKFMHDQGFRAIEDNGLLRRSVEDQEKIGKELARLGMTMGVFVIDGGDNWKTSL